MNHTSVLPSEVLSALDLRRRDCIIDATLGLGGHSEMILSSPQFLGTLYGIDQDPYHLEIAKQRLSPFSERFTPIAANFSCLKSILEEYQISFDGILFDLGVASPHFDQAERGFSYRLDGPLDMRMNPSSSITAAEILNRFSEDELTQVFFQYGEEKFARPIAQKICQYRSDKPLQSTHELVGLIDQVCLRYRKHRSSQDRAKKVFQALRILVNDEIAALRQGLTEALEHIEPYGRIVVISYHSIEDRLVKQLFQHAADPCTCPPKFPLCVCGLKPSIRILNRSPITPTSEEISENPRARSAKMRVCEKQA